MLHNHQPGSHVALPFKASRVHHLHCRPAKGGRANLFQNWDGDWGDIIHIDYIDYIIHIDDIDYIIYIDDIDYIDIDIEDKEKDNNCNYNESGGSR